MMRKLCGLFVLVPLVFGTCFVTPASADDSTNTELTRAIETDNETTQGNTSEEYALSQSSLSVGTQPGEATKALSGDERNAPETRDAQSAVAQVDVYRAYNPRTGKRLYVGSNAEYTRLVESGWYDEGIAWRSPNSSSISVHRLRNSNSGTYLYSSDPYEVSVLTSNGWIDEGVLCYGDEQNRSIAVYRLSNGTAYFLSSSEAEKNALVSGGWTNEGVLFYAGGPGEGKPWPEGAPALVTDEKIYRLYNPLSGEHLYTSSIDEVMVLSRNHWYLEGVAWTSPTWSHVPVYRLFLPATGKHHYVADRQEIDALTSLHGWKNEGVAWYSEMAKTVPVYRQFKADLTVGSHNYTTDLNEYNSNNSLHGWRGEDIAWYASGHGWSYGINVLSVSYFNMSISLDEMTQYQFANPYYGKYSFDDVRGHLNPDTVSSLSDENYQFLDLRSYTGMSADDINAFISSTASGRSGTLAGLGHVFVQASQQYQINEAYLVAHAVLETGWGTSQLSKGYYYDGTTPINGQIYPAGTYYNFFGIGAVDSNALGAGRATAIANGWNSPEAAILGGAEWISRNYIHGSQYGQPTLYAMKWDYERSSATHARGWHQYATDVGWAEKNARLVKSVYSMSSSAPAVSFIIPRYR